VSSSAIARASGSDRGKAVELGDHHGVAGSAGGERFAQARAFSVVPVQAVVDVDALGLDHGMWSARASGRTRQHQRLPSPAGPQEPSLTAASPDPLFRNTILFMVSEEQIQQWADEAETGYDVEEMKRRGRGRPGRGAEPMQVVAVRLTAEELAAVDAIAEREHISRSEAIRRALAGSAA
jgi:hypothetical protein